MAGRPRASSVASCGAAAAPKLEPSACALLSSSPAFCSPASSLLALADDERVAHRRRRLWRLAQRRAGRAPQADGSRPAGAGRVALGRQSVVGRARVPRARCRKRPKASPSACSPPASTSRASCASRRTATSSSPRAPPAASVCSAPPTARPSGERRDFADGLHRPFGIAFYPPGPGPALRLCRRDRPGRALPLPQRRDQGGGAGRGRRRRRCRPAAATGRATSPSRPTARRCSSRSARPPTSPTKCPTRRPKGSPPSWPSTRSAPPGARRRTAPTCSPSIPTAAACACSPPACATAPAWRSSRRPAALWCAVNERDGLGDDLPPDYATRVKPGALLRLALVSTSATTRTRASRASARDLAGKVTVPDVLIQAAFRAARHHVLRRRAVSRPTIAATPSSRCTARGTAPSAPATRWSGCRSKDGAPTGEYEDFLVGFVADDASVWGRPVGVAVAHDGALLVTDDAGGAIWRVAYQGR